MENINQKRDNSGSHHIDGFLHSQSLIGKKERRLI